MQTALDSAPAGPELASDGAIDQVANDGAAERAATDLAQPSDFPTSRDAPASDLRWTEQQACERSTNAPVCDYNGSYWPADASASCDLLALSTDGHSEAFIIAIVTSGPGPGFCCAGPSGGFWVTGYISMHFAPGEIVVHFDQDGGVPNGGDAGDSGISDGG